MLPLVEHGDEETLRTEGAAASLLVFAPKVLSPTTLYLCSKSFSEATSWPLAAGQGVGAKHHLLVL